MKKIYAIILGLTAFAAIAGAKDKPVTYEQLPAPAQTFISTYYQDVKLSYATKDDDILWPEYNVMLANGVRMEFSSSGELKNIEARTDGVPASLIPVQIKDYVQTHYPDSLIVKYEIERRSYEVTLSNRLELKFNTDFHLVEVDD